MDVRSYEMQMAAAAEGAVVTTEPEPALPVLRLRGAAPRAAGPRVTWTADTVEINEYSGKKKSKSAPLGRVSARQESPVLTARPPRRTEC